MIYCIIFLLTNCWGYVIIKIPVRANVDRPTNKKTQGRPLGYNLFVRFGRYNRVATSGWTSRQYGTGTGMEVDRLDPTQRAITDEGKANSCLRSQNSVHSWCTPYATAHTQGRFPFRFWHLPKPYAPLCTPHCL